MKTEFASQISIKIEGLEIEKNILTNLVSVIVDQHSHLLDMFTIRLYDSELEILEKGPFDLTKEIEIAAESTDGVLLSLIKGEITALEPEFGEGMIAELVVRGYDKSHRLFRESKSRAFLNAKDSDLAEEIAQSVGLKFEVEPTSTVYDHIFQHNQSDLVFLQQRAWRIGYECFVEDEKLFFRKPPTTTNDNPTLTWGDDLLSFRPRMTLAEQVDEVVVKGWNVAKQEPIVGKATNGSLYPQVGERKNGASWANAFGSGKLAIIDLPVVSQAEANVLAAARLNEVTGAFIEAEGTAFRRPDIKAGRMVTLDSLGDRFSGTYLVTNTTHVYSPEGLKTIFNVHGSRDGLLTDQVSCQEPASRWPGVVISVVTNTEDPKDWGRVKVKFPWMSEDAESDWARVLGIGAGPEAGLFVMPEVGDEVLVVFVHGDFSQPCVLGGLWNGQYKIPPESSSAPDSQKPLVRTWRSRSGHHITIFDNKEKKIEIVTADKQHITLNDKKKQIVLQNKDVKVTLKHNELIVDSAKHITLNAGSDIKLKANRKVEIEAGGEVNIKGAVINLN